MTYMDSNKGSKRSVIRHRFLSLLPFCLFSEQIHGKTWKKIIYLKFPKFHLKFRCFRSTFAVSAWERSSKWDTSISSVISEIKLSVPWFSVTCTACVDQSNFFIFFFLRRSSFQYNSTWLSSHILTITIECN